MRSLTFCLLVACGHASVPATTVATPPAALSYNPYPDRVRVEVLLDARSASAISMVGLADAFDIAPDHRLVVEDNQRMYIVGWGGIVPAEDIQGTLDAFAYTPDGILLGIRGTELVGLDANGTLQKVFALPSPGMGVARSPHGVFLFERARSDHAYGLYELVAGRRLRKILVSPRPIDGVSQTGDRLVFAAGGLAFQVVPGAPLTVVARLPGGAITSVAALQDKLVFSDGLSTYVVAKAGAAVLLKGVGGKVLYDGQGVVVLDSTHRAVVRVVDGQ